MKTRLSWLFPPLHTVGPAAALILLEELARPSRGRVFFYFLFALQGAWRAYGFHPAYLGSYREWLERTPWTASRPLPLGPIYLVPGDAVILSGLVLLAAIHPAADPWVGVFIFASSYLLVLALSFLPTGVPALGYAVAFGLGAMCIKLPVRHGWVAVAVALYLVCLWGLRRSMASFPWKVRLDVLLVRLGQRLHGQTPEGDDLLKPSWPFRELGPSLKGLRMNQSDAALGSLLAGWWMHVALQRAPAEAAGMILWVVVIPAAFARILIYVVGRGPPVSLGGRIQLLQPILPGYDRVFVAPLLGVLAALAIPWVLERLGLSPQIFNPVALWIALWAILALGPRLVEWRLTGRHRLSSPLIREDRTSGIQVS